MPKILKLNGSHESICDIVFIHGLDGDIRQTWCPEKKTIEESWPQWIADEIPEATVWSVGYDAASSEWLGHSMPIVNRATSLLSLFEIHGIGKRPVALIGHSMGGLLIKQMLRHADGYGHSDWNSFATNLNLVIFVATPHHGSAIPSFLDSLRIVLRPSASVNDLKAHSPALSDLNNWFRAFVQKTEIGVVSFHEELKTSSIMVVDATSADFGYPGIISRPIKASHIQICKPASIEDDIVKYSMMRLKAFVNKLKIASTVVIPGASSIGLTYSKTTEVDDRCLEHVLNTKQPCEIFYYENIASTINLLDSYARDPDPFLRKIPYLRKMQDDKTRRTAAANFELGIHENNDAVQQIINQNRTALASFIARLQSDSVSTDLARRALKAFGTFAALRLIVRLQRFYDIVDDKVILFFQSYEFAENGPYGSFELVPQRSATGKRVWGYWYYIRARVGPNPGGEDYAKATIPLSIARRLFKDNIRGDADTFYTWGLPQFLIFGGPDYIDGFQLKSWMIILMADSFGKEWQERYEEDPWKELVE